MPTDHSAFGSSSVQPTTLRDLLGAGCPRTTPLSVHLQDSLLLFEICWALDAQRRRPRSASLRTIPRSVLVPVSRLMVILTLLENCWRSEPMSRSLRTIPRSVLLQFSLLLFDIFLA